jgi:hypothetical protein
MFVLRKNDGEVYENRAQAAEGIGTVDFTSACHFGSDGHAARDWVREGEG